MTAPEKRPVGRPRKAPAPAVSERMIDEWVTLHGGGAGESIETIATVYKMSGHVVRHHLKKRGALTPSAEPAEMDPESDEALGIGQDEDADDGAASLEALMANPAFEKLLEAAVARKMAEMGHQAPQQSATGSLALNAFLEKIEHVIGVRDEQRAGYMKPLSAEEMDARRRGDADMRALLKQFKAEGVWPKYLIVGEGPGAFFYGPSPNGDISYEAGQEINCRLPPSELFQPLNEPAARIIEAYRRSVGEPVPIEDLVAQAIINARGGVQAPQVEQTAKVIDPDVQLVDAPKRDVGPKRTFGTITPELRGKSMPSQPGVSAQPAGPIFVDAGA